MNLLHSIVQYYTVNETFFQSFLSLEFLSVQGHVSIVLQIVHSSSDDCTHSRRE